MKLFLICNVYFLITIASIALILAKGNRIILVTEMFGDVFLS